VSQTRQRGKIKTAQRHPRERVVVDGEMSGKKNAEKIDTR